MDLFLRNAGKQGQIPASFLLRVYQFGGEEMIEIVLNDPENEEVIAKVRNRVNETMKKYPLFAW